MARPNVFLDASLSSVLDDNSYILGELASHLLAASFIPQFDAFRQTWFTTDQARTLLGIAAGKSQGAVGGADTARDDFVGRPAGP